MGIDLPQAGALLLAGGASRRMGRDKAALPWRGGTFLERIAGELAGFPERYLSANLENCPLPPPWQLVADRFPGCGPLAGLHAGLCVCRSPWLVAVSCDLPLLQRPLVEWLARQAAPPYGAVVPRDQAGRIHPLCAVYAKTLAPLAQAQLEAGDYRMGSLLERVQVLYLPVGEAFSAMLANINTPEDYRALQAGKLWPPKRA